MWKTILDILFPIHCLGCGQEGDFVCLTCFKNLPLNTEKSKGNLLVASYYENPLVKQIIHRYKYDFVKDLAKPLSLLMIKKLESEIGSLGIGESPEVGHYFVQESQKVRPQKVGTFSKKVPLFRSDLCLVPIPLHKKRLRWRGFNQAELLAQEIGQKLNIPVINNLLIRTKNTLPQATIENAQERRENINQAFELVSFPRKRESRNKLIWIPNQVGNDKNSIEVRPRVTRVILIDDISTTGATLDQAAQALLPLNPKQIWKLVVARG